MIGANWLDIKSPLRFWSIHYLPSLNYVTSRLITVNFNQQRVATVVTVDSVAGVYIEPRPDSTKKVAAPAKTPGKPGTTPPKKPAVPSVVPLPTKPPTKPPTGRDRTD